MPYEMPAPPGQDRCDELQLTAGRQGKGTIWVSGGVEGAGVSGGRTSENTRRVPGHNHSRRYVFQNDASHSHECAVTHPTAVD